MRHTHTLPSLYDIANMEGERRGIEMHFDLPEGCLSLTHFEQINILIEAQHRKERQNTCGIPIHYPLFMVAQTWKGTG